ncbi:hypothetical protein [Streptomyces sp. NPDC056227]|uniref:hypothetical protein n=1 Tax=Streptomyces sp. NPDC056227 TaxID=3345753 RepID=UPI0035E21AD9
MSPIGDINEGQARELQPVIKDYGQEAAVATVERALAQQRRIYDALGAGVLAAALLYDLGRGERLRHELRQYAN